MSVVWIVLRSVRLATWRELAYLLLGFAMSIATFVVVVTLVSLGVSLLITLVGVPILLATAYVNRWFADLERRRAAFLLREPVGRSYRDPSRPGFWQRIRAVAADPQTWKDYGWLALLAVVGFAFGLAAIVFWSVALGLLSVPLWWWIPPDGTVLAVMDGDRTVWSVDSWWWAVALGAAGVVVAVLTTWICAGLAHGQARLARLLLAPDLQERVEELERTRAGAVVAQQDELERIERDLHDGAQARLVSLAMDLGLAREKLEADPAAAAALVESAHDEAKTALAGALARARGAPGRAHGSGSGRRAVGARRRQRGPPCRSTCTREAVSSVSSGPPRTSSSRNRSRTSRSTPRPSTSGSASPGEARLSRSRCATTGAAARIGGAGSGVAGLARRVEAIDGTFEVVSRAGDGTIVRAEIPCGS